MKTVYISEFRQSLVLATPFIASCLSQVGMELVDTVMMGQLGPKALAAGALANAFYLMVLVICFAITASVGITLSQAHGAGDKPQARHQIQQGLWLSVLLSMICLPLLWFSPLLLPIMGQSPLLIGSVSIYMHFLMWAFLPGLFFSILRNFAAIMEYGRIVLILAVLGIPATGILDYVLMYGKWIFPAMGIAGIGLATTIVSCAIVLILFAFIFGVRKLKEFHLFHSFSLPNLTTLLHLLKLGYPIGLATAFEVGLFTATALLMGLFGVIPLAAHQIAMQCSVFTFMLPFGIAQASTLRIGSLVGAKEYSRLKTVVIVDICLGLLFACTTALLFIFAGKPIVSLFISGKPASQITLVNYAVSFLKIAGAYQIVDAIQVICNGALRGLQDTFVPMLLCLCAYWLIGFTSSYLLAFHLHLQGQGLWWGLVIGLATTSILLLSRFFYQVNHKFIMPSTTISS